ncbi:hypothetical protein ACS0TY_023190 [Phlomoides rotata]
MKMEGRVGSGVLKKKSSSGCLIIKKTGLNKKTGGWVGGSSESSEEKRRARLVDSSSSDSSSSDEDESLEFMRRRVNDKRLKNGSMGNKRKELENRDNAGVDDGTERKRSRLDLFEFDEYDEFDGNETRNEFSGHRFKVSGQNSSSGKMKESGVSSKKNFVVDKRKQGSSHLDGSGSRKSKEKGSSGVRNKGLGLEDDDAHMPISLLRSKYQETAGESIRLQGKNGVLKVMVNKKKKVDLPSQPESYDPRERKERKGSRSDDVVMKDLVQSPVNSDSKTPEHGDLMVDKERSVEKKKKVKPSSGKGRKVEDSDADGVDTVLKLATPRREASSSKKGEKKQAEKSPPEHITPVKGREGKEGSAKRAGSTEKQKLREKIRQMLLDAGWTIDYRPRRNRDYLDAVYINPSGTAYWSIVKAYDAFKKLSGEDNGKVKADVGSPSSAPLSEDMINKLTRQTKKKIAEAMKRKRKEDGMTKSAKRIAVREAAESSDSDQSEERLSSFMKQKQKSRGRSCKVDQDSGDDTSDDLLKMKPRKVRDENPSKSRVIQGRTSKVTGRCTLLVRGSNRDENFDSDGFVQYTGKRTVLAWLIDSGTVKLSEKVQYMNRRRSRVMLEGWITRDGIHCGCCSKILTVSKFELHAGSKLRQPFQNIFLESGSSLLQCQIDAWNSQEESLRRDFFIVDVDGDDPDDDTCGICGDGGDLICCDSCPSTFHQICLGIQLLPSGDWHCPNCTCKFCGSADECVAEKNNGTGNELEQCHFCEKKYHKLCSERTYTLPQSSNGASFCGPKCQEIYDHLEKILGIRHELEAGISWSLIQRKDVSDTSQRGFPLRVECNAKLAVASSAMDECFLPIIDRRSGINMIHNVVNNCGSNFNRLNFCRFYTAILERGDEIIAAASIRLHGDRLAEMPFIATREIYRRQGMCRRLLSAIETELRSLKVHQLFIPAISEHMNTWTTVFGFHELTDIDKKKIKTMSMLVFPGTDMLQKKLVKHENSDGAKVSGSTKNQRRLPVPVKKSEVNSSLEQNRQASSDSEGCPEQNRQASKIEVDALDLGSPVVTAPSDSVHEANNAVPSASDAVSESDIVDKGSTAFEPEMGKTQKESSDRLKCSPTPADNKPSAKDDSNECKTEAPCPKSSPDTSDKTQEAAADSNGGIGSEVNSMKVSEGADPSKIISNGCLEPHPGSVSKVSSKDAIKTSIMNQDSVPTSALPEDEESTVAPDADLDDMALLKAECDVAVDRPENNKPDGEIKAIDHPETNEDLSIPQVAVDRHETVKPDGEMEAIDHPETNENLSITLVAVDSPETDKPDGEIKAIDNPETNEDLSFPQVAVDRPETNKPDGVIEAIDHPKTNEDLSITEESIDRLETDKPDGENKSIDHPETNEVLIETIDLPETGKSDGENDTIDLPKTNEDLSIPQVAVDHPETDKPNGENKAIDHPETNEDLSITQETIGCSEADKPDGENKSIDHLETNGDLSVAWETIDHPETSKPDEEKETIDRPETNEPGEKNEKPCLVQNTAVTENHVQ